MSKKPKIVIMPDIGRCEARTKTAHDNTWTIHYSWMLRLDCESGEMRSAHVNSNTYWEWLREYEREGDIPPHIQFGGAIEAGEPDPGFYKRWVKYASATFIPMHK